MCWSPRYRRNVRSRGCDVGDVVIGLDVGTTAIKAAAFDARSGVCVASVGHALRVRLGRDGGREQSVSALRSVAVGALEEVAAALRRGDRVIGIGVAAQGGSAAVVDAATGRSRTPMHLWNDLRFMPHLADVASRKPPAWWRRLSRREGAGWGLGRISWLTETQPALFSPNAKYVGVGEVVVHALTGEWVQDACNALQQGCFDVTRRRISPEALAVVGMNDTAVARLRRGDEQFSLSASVRGVSKGTPIVGPYMDHEAGWRACAAGGRGNDVLQLSLGTAWVANFALSRREKYWSPFQLVVPSPASADDDLVIQPLLTGNVSWDWVWRDLLGAPDAADGARRIWGRASSPLPPEGLTALPWLNMPSPLSPARTGAGMVLGVGPSTTREDIARAVTVGMAHELRRVLAEVTARGDVARVVVTGGAAKSRGWLKLVAMALGGGVATHVAREESLVGCRGAVAALSAPAGSARVAPGRIKTDDKTLRRFDDDHARYLQAFEVLYGAVPAGGRFSFASPVSAVASTSTRGQGTIRVPAATPVNAPDDAPRSHRKYSRTPKRSPE